MHARSLHPGSRSRAALPVAVLAGFVALSVAFCGRGADWTHRLLASSGGDAWSFVWFLNWWPWALFHGHGLLHSGFVYAPDGYDLSWATAVPTASLLALPVTLVFGADVSFNVLSALAPGLDGFSAFLLLRRCGATPIAGIAGGLVYGFSPFEAGQLQGHLNLDLTFPIPLACLLVVSRVQDRIGRRGFIAGLAATLLFEFGLSAEMFATFCCLGAGAWLLFVCLCRAPLRPVLLRAAAEAAVSLVVVAVLLLPWLLSMRAGAARIPGFNNPPWFYSTNLLNLIVPTRLTLLGGRLFAAVSGRFDGNLSEQGGYLGLPLLAVLVLLFREGRRDRAVLALLLLFALLVIASLGPSLHAGSWNSRLPLPWWVALHLPLLKAALPARISCYAILVAAIAAALWLDNAVTTRGRRQRMAVLGLVVATLLPAPRMVHWLATPRLPFFRPDRVEAALGSDATVLVLPFLFDANGAATPAMLWQWQSGMRYRQTGGYLSFLPFPDARLPFVQSLAHGEPGPDFRNDLSAYLVRAGASAVLAGPGTGPALLGALRGLGWPEQDQGGVALFRVPPADTLRFAALTGETWPNDASSSWLGHYGVVITHGRGAVLHLSGAGLPLPATTVTVQADGAAPHSYPIAFQGRLDIPLPANNRYRIVPGATFRPGIAWGTPDTRTLSFLVTLRPD